jgi:dinuclear metal center YbgI/SA1388 family protein
VPLLHQLIDDLDGWYDPRWAEPWDAVGLVCGDPSEPADRILLAVDPVAATVDEAIVTGAQVLITHHPLLLGAVHAVPADDPRGALVHRLIRAGVALFVAHTNADVADPGVSDALAELFGLRELRPLDPMPAVALDKLVVFVPSPAAPVLIDALSAAGAGRLGDYDRCAWTAVGEGTFRARAGAHPAIGEVGEITVVTESRIEMVVAASVRAKVLDALHRTHPYEQPAYDLVAMVERPSTRGLGRIGELDADLTLADFTELAARVLPPTAWGVRAAGAPEQRIRTVAVCGGAGSSLIGAARAAGADVLVSSDLKHHQALDAVSGAGGGGPGDRGLALLDAAHWATERPFLDQLAARLKNRYAPTSTTVDIAVSRHVTDPWTLHAPSSESSSNRP